MREDEQRGWRGEGDGADDEGKERINKRPGFSLCSLPQNNNSLEQPMDGETMRESRVSGCRVCTKRPTKEDNTIVRDGGEGRGTAMCVCIGETKQAAGAGREDKKRSRQHLQYKVKKKNDRIGGFAGARKTGRGEICGGGRRRQDQEEGSLTELEEVEAEEEVAGAGVVELAGPEWVPLVAADPKPGMTPVL